MINKKMWYVGETTISKSFNFKTLKKNPFYQKISFGKIIIVISNKVNILAHWFMISPYYSNGNHP
jgi:hypothetical protein